MTWLFASNFLLAQWFFVRLAKEIDRDTLKVVRWAWMGPIVPLTGWWSNYIWLKRKRV